MRIKSKDFKIDDFQILHNNNISNVTDFDSDMVDGFNASQTPTPNTLLPLDENGKYPSSAFQTHNLGDVDTVDGKHASDFADATLSNVDDMIILNKTKLVDGHGSGLDADTLDGMTVDDILSSTGGDGSDADTISGYHAEDLYISKVNITQMGKSTVGCMPFVVNGKLYQSVYARLYDTTTNSSFYTAFHTPDKPIYDGLIHPRPTPIPSNIPIKKIAGFRNAYAACLLENGDLYTWGHNGYGACGAGHTTIIYTPILVDTDVIDIFDHPTQAELDPLHGRLFILKQDGLYAAGYNAFGQLGIGSTTDASTFTKCVGFDNTSSDYIKAVYPMESTYGFTFVLTSDGKIWFAGSNTKGVAGDGTTTNKNSFIDVTQYWADPNKTVDYIKVSGGARYSTTSTPGANNQSIAMLIKYTDGTSEVKTCGYNVYGQLGDGTTTNSTTPVSPLNIPTDGSIVDIAGFGGERITYQALTSTGDLYAWGYNLYGATGDGTFEHRYTPIITETGVTKLLCDGKIGPYNTFMTSFICKEDGLYAVGYNGSDYAVTGTGITSSVTQYTKVFLPEDDNQVVDLYNAYFYNAYNILIYTTKGNLYFTGDPDNYYSIAPHIYHIPIIPPALPTARMFS